ncbi:hypothetical protein [uncultured Jatrophihabitans sp.]|uniref:hypothetical protein n=1 Tax=uncultured Jatrophihabitans sp. TaxID=1610747 RepID=UPI0035C992C1
MTSAAPTHRVADPATSGLPIGAGLVLMLGSILPWFHVLAIGGDGDISGLQTDGSTTIVLGLLSAVLGVIVKVAKARIWVVIVGTVSSVLALAIVISKLVDLFGLEDEIDLGIEYGIWVALVAAALCVFAAARCLRRLVPVDEAHD